MADEDNLPQILSLGDTVSLGTILANIHMMGTVTNLENLPLFSATFEAFGDQGVLNLPVLKGDKGDPGQPQFALRFQNDNLASPSELPTDLTNSEADIGKYWIFKTVDAQGNVTGSQMYIWYGAAYRTMPVGSQGPPGPYPVITPTVKLLDPKYRSFINVSGPKSHPRWELNLAVPHGPQGPATSIAKAPDVDMSKPPRIGQVLGFAGQYTKGGAPVFQPMSIGDIMPAPYTVPQSAFHSYNGISTAKQTVCTWDMPVQDWPWKPFLWGQVEVAGFSIAAQPLLVGVEVRIGDPNNGPLVAKGIGNTSGSVTLIPRSSEDGAESRALTRDNKYARIEAGEAQKLYVNLINEGLASVYDFEPSEAGLAMLAVPLGTEKALPTTYFGQFTGSGGLSAEWKHYEPQGS